MAISWDYIAGFFDADGCVSIFKTGSQTVKWDNSNQEVIIKIRDFICDYLGYDQKKKIDHTQVNGYLPMYSIRFGHRLDVLKLTKILLRKCIVKKRDLVKAYYHVKNQIAKNGTIVRRGTFLKYLVTFGSKERAREQVLELRAKGMKYREIVEATGVPRSTIGDWVAGKP